MAMRSVFFKEHEGIVQNYSGNGPLSAVAYGQELSAGGNICQFGAACKEHGNQQAGLEKGYTNDHLFTLFSGSRTTGKGEKTLMHNVSSIQDVGCRTIENQEKTRMQAVSSDKDAYYQLPFKETRIQTISSDKDANYQGPFELGFGQPLICVKYPPTEQCYGVYSTYGSQIGGHVMLPLSMTTERGPIFVNPKQYGGILRRRKKRAAAKLENKVSKIRKPFLHLSRHLHALRRTRGNGGRFLNTKNLNNDSNLEKTAKEKM